MMRAAALLLLNGGTKTSTRANPRLSLSETNRRPDGSKAIAEGIANRLEVVAVAAVTAGCTEGKTPRLPISRLAFSGPPDADVPAAARSAAAKRRTQRLPGSATQRFPALSKARPT